MIARAGTERQTEGESYELRIKGEHRQHHPADQEYDLLAAYKKREDEMKVDSQEYKDLMAKWSREAYAEEMNTAWESHLEYEDAMGQKRDNTPKKCTEGSNHVY